MVSLPTVDEDRALGKQFRVKGQRILFLVTEDWYFASHRLHFAQELLKAGYRVAVGCRFSGTETRIRAAGILPFPVPFGRESLSVRKALKEGMGMRRLIRQYRPDLVHLVALRPILLGWLAGIGQQRRPSVNAITGLGSMFTGRLNSWRLRATQRMMLTLMRPVFGHSAAYNVFQNEEDLDGFVARGYGKREQSFLIRGAGVDPASWLPRPEPVSDEPVVLFVGRLLREKGLQELLDASSILKSKGVSHRLRVVGAPDSCSPKSFSEEEIRNWQAEGLMDWLGKRTDVLEQMSQAHLVVLPSYYREGLPKVLLEAGLARRAVVTCDVVGCREIVKHGRNGILVPPRDPVALAAAIEGLLNSPALRSRLAAAHYEIVCRDFSLEQVTRQFLELYDIALKGVASPAPGRINA